MEVAAFVIGLSGVIAVVDKACQVWRAIGAAKDFGDDVGGSIRKLEIEFFRFHSWWRVVEKLELRSQSVEENAACSGGPLAVHLSGTTQNPIITAAQGVLSALVDIESTLGESGVLEALELERKENHPAKRQRVTETPELPNPPSVQVKEAASARARLSQHLVSAVPWRKRIRQDATPWRESHKQRLDSKIQEIGYWNQVLYSLLPHDLRESILRQGISSYVLADTEEVALVSRLDEGAISQQARFYEAHKRLAENNSLGPTAPEVLQQRLIPMDAFDAPGVVNQGVFSLVRYRHEQGEPVLIEWYNLPHSASAHLDLRSVALERLAKLSILLSKDRKPQTLCTADSIGCVESTHLRRLGLVSRVPDGLSPSKLPISLYNLLCRKPLPSSSCRAPLPTLPQRFQLAATLASSLYTFMLARWHHKMFNSLNIAFMFPSHPDGTGGPLPELERPLVFGYSVCRPSAPEELSINESESSLSEFYLHPRLRVPPPGRPRYELKYEIYAFGLLLAEIGFWQPISRIGAASSPRQGGVSAEGFKAEVTRKCESDLGCWMGEQYRDVTVRCLRAAETAVGSNGSRSVEELTGFYWDVVWELVRCAERVKVLG